MAPVICETSVSCRTTSLKGLLEGSTISTTTDDDYVGSTLAVS